MDKLVYILSGEFALAGRPNGGTAVFLRSLWVTLLIYLLVLPIKSYCSKGAVFQFSAAQLRIEVGETLPWVGAIFAGAYAAFYSRFAAQWSYLASLYNQIMAACVVLTPENRTSNQALVIWNAAFIEDAQDLHLAGKSMFKAIVVGLLQNEQIVRVFLESTEGGANRLRKLESALGFTAAVSADISDPPPNGGP